LSPRRSWRSKQSNGMATLEWTHIRYFSFVTALTLLAPRCEFGRMLQRSGSIGYYYTHVCHDP
jgi:hypothetical protein